MATFHMTTIYLADGTKTTFRTPWKGTVKYMAQTDMGEDDSEVTYEDCTLLGVDTSNRYLRIKSSEGQTILLELVHVIEVTQDTEAEEPEGQSVFFSGGTPSADMGKDGDVCFAADGTVYQYRQDAGWEKVMTIRVSTEDIIPEINPDTMTWWVAGVDTHCPVTGPQGETGPAPTINPENNHWMVGDDDTGVEATGPVGPAGPPGKDGAKGKTGDTGKTGAKGESAYEAAKRLAGEAGKKPPYDTEQHWIESLKGEPGQSTLTDEDKLRLVKEVVDALAAEGYIVKKALITTPTPETVAMGEKTVNDLVESLNITETGVVTGTFKYIEDGTEGEGWYFPVTINTTLAKELVVVETAVEPVRSRTISNPVVVIPGVKTPFQQEIIIKVRPGYTYEVTLDGDHYITFTFGTATFIMRQNVIPADEAKSYLGKSPKDFQQDLVWDPNTSKFSGTLHYIRDFKQFSPGNPEKWKGYYVYITLRTTGEQLSLKKNGEYTKQNITFDPDLMLRIEDKTDYYEIEVDGQFFAKLDFSEVTLDPRTPDITVFTEERDTKELYGKKVSELVDTDFGFDYKGNATGTVHWVTNYTGYSSTGAPYGWFIPMHIETTGENITFVSDGVDKNTYPFDADWVVRITAPTKTIGFKIDGLQWITIDLSKCTFEMPIEAIPVDTQLDEYKSGELFEDPTFTLDKESYIHVGGTFKYAVGYTTKFGEGAEGNFLPLRISSKFTGTNMTWKRGAELIGDANQTFAQDMVIQIKADKTANLNTDAFIVELDNVVLCKFKIDAEYAHKVTDLVDDDYLGKNLADLCDGVTFSESIVDGKVVTKVTGTLHYVWGYTGFSSGDEVTQGWYLPFQIHTGKADPETKIDVSCNGHLSEDDAYDTDWIIRVTDKTQPIKICYADTETELANIDVSGLTLESPITIPEGETEYYGKKVKLLSDGAVTVEFDTSKNAFVLKGNLKYVPTYPDTKLTPDGGYYVAFNLAATGSKFSTYKDGAAEKHRDGVAYDGYFVVGLDTEGGWSKLRVDIDGVKYVDIDFTQLVKLPKVALPAPETTFYDVAASNLITTADEGKTTLTVQSDGVEFKVGGTLPYYKNYTSAYAGDEANGNYFPYVLNIGSEKMTLKVNTDKRVKEDIPLDKLNVMRVAATSDVEEIFVDGKLCAKLTFADATLTPSS